MKGCSIIICTRNRAELLGECIRSFEGQLNPDLQELIVVDNDSSDNTPEVVSAFKQAAFPILHVVENKIGLSHARNRGVQESKFDWVCFMDDDALVHSDYVAVMMQTIQASNYDGFGGMFYPWYRTPKPKWLSPEFGKMPMLLNAEGLLPDHLHVAGGICAFDKSKLLKAGGFPPDIGMRGDVVGYGEENHLQDEMRKLGARIGFVPTWKMDHLVAPYKYTLTWQLKRFVGKGRDKQIRKGAISMSRKIMLSARALLVFGYYSLRFLPKLIFQPTYFWQNYLLDVFQYPAIVFGRVSV
jgi:glycosyltransferase involved in cell wall biosynthesis